MKWANLVRERSRWEAGQGAGQKEGADESHLLQNPFIDTWKVWRIVSSQYLNECHVSARREGQWNPESDRSMIYTTSSGVGKVKWSPTLDARDDEGNGRRLCRQWTPVSPGNATKVAAFRRLPPGKRSRQVSFLSISMAKGLARARLFSVGFF